MFNGSLTHSILPVPQNSEVTEGSCSQQPLAIQVCHNAESRQRCEQSERKCSCCTDLRKQSQKFGQAHRYTMMSAYTWAPRAQQVGARDERGH